MEILQRLVELWILNTKETGRSSQIQISHLLDPILQIFHYPQDDPQKGTESPQMESVSGKVGPGCQGHGAEPSAQTALWKGFDPSLAFVCRRN